MKLLGDWCPAENHDNGNLLTSVDGDGNITYNRKRGRCARRSLEKEEEM
jgi:hypothetical protein